MSEHLFDEDDLKGFFRKPEKPEEPKELEKVENPRIPIKVSRKEPPPPKPSRNQNSNSPNILGIFWLFLRGLGIFILIFVVSFIVINFPAIYSNFNYYRQGAERSPGSDQLTPTQTDIYSDNSLIIPKIFVNAPVIWQVPENEVLNKLENGVASYAGTAMPGAVGNVFIVGHSSYYLWSPGNYKTIFALLDNLETGDKIYIKYQNKVFTYQVKSKETVSPDNLEVLTTGSGKQLKLMTCIPIGTNLKRLIVTADQI